MLWLGVVYVINGLIQSNSLKMIEMSTDSDFAEKKQNTCLLNNAELARKQRKHWTGLLTFRLWNFSDLPGGLNDQ